MTAAQLDNIVRLGKQLTPAQSRAATSSAVQRQQRHGWPPVLMKAWTDYPFPELGDTPGHEAPVREITVLSYDGDKYCRISVDGVEFEIKAGYIYARPGRYGEVEVISWQP